MLLAALIKSWSKDQIKLCMSLLQEIMGSFKIQHFTTASRRASSVAYLDSVTSKVAHGMCSILPMSFHLAVSSFRTAITLSTVTREAEIMKFYGEDTIKVPVYLAEW